MSNRKKPNGYTQHPINVQAIGDSLTRNYTSAMADADFWPARLAAALTAAGLPAAAKNNGVSGNRTGTMLKRKTALTMLGTPAIGVVFGGVNDPAGGAVSLTSSNVIGDTKIRTTGGYTDFEIGAYLTVGGNTYKVTNYYVPDAAVVVTPPLVADIPNGTPIYHATANNLQAIGQHLIDNGCSHVAVVSAQYLNFASNTGDTLATDYATYAPVRVKQAAAAVALAAANPTKKVIFVNLHAYLKALITGGTVTQGNDVAWHVAVGDQHFNTTGQQYVANAIYAAIAAAGWVGELA